MQAAGSIYTLQVVAAPVITKNPSLFCFTGDVVEDNSATGQRVRQRLNAKRDREK